MLSQTEARELVERCMRVLYYRDARSYNRVRSDVNNKDGGTLTGRFSVVVIRGSLLLKIRLLNFLFPD